MACSVQGCHKCLSEEEKAAKNTSCYFFFFFCRQERKGTQRFEDVSGGGDERGRRDGMKTGIKPVCL